MSTAPTSTHKTKDIWGLETEEKIKQAIINNADTKEIDLLLAKGWAETNNPSFKFWDLLKQEKEKEGAEFKKSHVMVRDSPITLYLCHKHKLHQLFDETIKSCLTYSIKFKLLFDTFLLSVQIPDQELAKKILALNNNVIKDKDQKPLEKATEKGHKTMVEFLCKNGSIPNGNRDIALKTAIVNEDEELIAYFVRTSDFKHIDYYFLNQSVAQACKSKSFATLLKLGVYLEGNDHMLIRSINQSLKDIRPQTHIKELSAILKEYSHKGIKSLAKHKNKEVAGFAIKEIERRKLAKLSQKIQSLHNNELEIDLE